MKLRIRAALLLLLLWCGHSDVYSQRVLFGDYPDPSVTKIGNTYWATATSSNWAPVFPLFSSDNLKTWMHEGAVFNKLPAWADYYFWAPEISYENGKVYVYYSAHKRGGNLCIGVATADQPTGPYRDLGPIMCQEAGSIDAFPMRDEKGKLFLIWKEDGNSVKKPTPIWAMEMKEDRSGFIGEKVELFRNDQPWEGNLVEGVSMMRHGEYFYAFYAASSCCGKECNYVTGIARAKSLVGAWEKYEKNPILVNEGKWICPGHGTPTEFLGGFYFFYHAYHKQNNVYTGREGMVCEFTFTPDGWIKFEKPETDLNGPFPLSKDEFNTPSLRDDWQWSVFNEPTTSQRNGRLYIAGNAKEKISYIGRRTLTLDYNVRATIDRKETTGRAGVAIIGDDEHVVGVRLEGGKLVVYSLNGKNEERHVVEKLPKSDVLYIDLAVANGKDIVVSYSLNNKDFIKVNETPVNGGFLPPWDRAMRVGLTVTGSANEVGVFDFFSMELK